MKPEIDELIEAYLDDLSQTGPAAARQVQSLRDFIAWVEHAGGQPFSNTAINPTRLHAYRAHLRADPGLSQAEISQKLGAVRGFGQWLDWRNAEPVGGRHEMVEADMVRDIRRQLDELRALMRIIETLSRSLDPRRAIEESLEVVTELMDLDTGWAFLLDQDGAFHLIADYGLPPALLAGDRLSLRGQRDCKCQDMCRRGDLLRAVNVVECSRLENAAGDRRDLRYHASIPLHVEGRMLGILNVTSPDRQVFDGDSLRFLTAVGSQISIAVERAELFEMVRSQRVQEQAALLRLSSRLLETSLDPQEIIDRVVGEAAAVLGVDACALLLPELDDRPLLHAAVGFEPETIEASRHGRILPGSAADVAMRDRRSIVTADLLADSTYPVPDSLHRHGFRSLLVVPVLLRDRAIGALQVTGREPRDFSEDEVRLLSLMATQAAIAIHNAREYEEKSQEAWHRNALLQVVENLRDLSQVEDVAGTLVRITPLLVGAEGCMLFLAAEAGDDVLPAPDLRPAQAFGLTRDQRAFFESLGASSSVRTVLAETLRLQAPAVLQPGALGAPDLFDDAELLVVPIVSRRETLGILILVPRPGRGPFSPRQTAIATGIADQAAIAFQTARLSEVAEVKVRMERELNMARELQSRLIPEHPPVVPGFEIEAVWRAAREVAGDFYDFISLPDGKLGLLIADVSGKGMPAALFMAGARSILRANAAQGLSPAEALLRANALILADHDADMFVTCVYLVLDPATRRLIYARAGHNYPIWWSPRTGQIQTLRADGIALGVVHPIDLSEEQVELQSGDVVVLYTDGITEALDDEQREFGTHGLVSVLRANPGASSGQLVREIIAAVESHAAGRPQFDDLTAVLIRAL